MYNQAMPAAFKKSLRLAAILLVWCLYLAYVIFIIRENRGPVDYETFMDIGGRLLRGQEVYGVNSYYPLPMVMVFAAFAALPRALSMALWLLLPVTAAFTISGGSLSILLFAPVFGHFVGGQSALFALLGLWGYRKFIRPQQAAGGALLALTLLKPQLGLFPILWAAWQWLQALRTEKRIPRQAWAFAAAAAALYLPAFILQPDWPLRWLSNPRPVFYRAVAGLFPRVLMLLTSPHGWIYWLALLLLGGGLFTLVWRAAGRRFSLDLWVLASFAVSPLVHDYDLLQLTALLDTPQQRRLAALLSLPGWIVILFFYQTDAAWMAFTIIAPGLLWLKCRQASCA